MDSLLLGSNSPCLFFVLMAHHMSELRVGMELSQTLAFDAADFYYGALALIQSNIPKKLIPYKKEFSVHQL